MKSNQRGEMSFGTLIIILVATVMFFAMWADSASCASKWEDSGFATKWGPMKGCVVKLPDGRWLPEEVLRDSSIATIVNEPPK